MARKVTLNEFLTPEEIQKAQELFAAHAATPTRFHKECVDKIIRPNLKRINASLGQKNDPDYLAYAVEYVLGREAQ